MKGIGIDMSAEARAADRIIRSGERAGKSARAINMALRKAGSRYTYTG